MKIRVPAVAALVMGVAGVCTAAAGAFVGAVSWLTYQKVTHPIVGNYGVPEFEDTLERESVSFTSSDGTELAAWYVPGARPEPVLLLHGYGATKREMLHHAGFLSRAGYPLLLLDLRCCGESGGRAVTFGGLERDDVAAALAFLRERPDVDGERIGILGLSLGGALALMAAADCPAVRAVVAESSFATIQGAIRQNFRGTTRLPHFPFAPLTVWLVERRHGVRAARIAPEREIGARDDCAVLLIHSETDNVVTVQDAHALYAAARGPKELWLLPDADHAMAYVTEGTRYEGRVTEFFDRWLGQRHTRTTDLSA